MMVGSAKGGRILNNILAVPQKAFHKFSLLVLPSFRPFAIEVCRRLS